MDMQDHIDSVCKIIKYVTKYKGIESIEKVRIWIFIQTNYRYNFVSIRWAWKTYKWVCNIYAKWFITTVIDMH